MNVDHPKYLHSVKTKEAAAAATTTTIGVASCKVGRRRRLISREASNLSNFSVEAGGGEYHAQEPAAVPFVWESSPGTPKRHIIMRSSNCDHEVDHLFPPLTPPPSYQYKGNKYATTRIRPAFTSSKKKKENDANSNNNVNLIQSIFPRLSFTRDHSPTLSSSSSTKSSSLPSTSSSSSPSSQSRSVVSTPPPIHRQKLSFEYPSAEVEEEEEERVVGIRRSGSPVSTLCFSRLSCCNAKFRGLYSTWF
ncbi:uncharacterized protein LOC110684614 [Chenopodium quinoa]|uniref:uncharacterized protein LOC110684614 n=1 Tax=Chenopodium quinoa TaxID=63459 RepID=UPI000B76CC7E|nr:uncharacterized protein LOC110684614 [Chenopodium quinoa]